MAEQENGAAAPQDQQPQVRFNTLHQFIRDLSFENILAQKGQGGEVQPEISVAVNLEPKKRSTEHQFEVVMKLNITSKNKDDGVTLFLMELEYAGVFHIDGVPNEQLHPFLMIECPRMLFPFVRRIVSDVTRDAGFPPLNLETIDFVNLYRQELARRQQETDQQQPPERSDA